MANMINRQVGLTQFVAPQPLQTTVVRGFFQWITNVLTLGIRNSSGLILHDRKVALLEKNKLSLQLQLLNIERCFDEVSGKLEHLSLNLVKMSTDDITAQVYGLKESLHNLKFKRLELESEITPVAMEVFFYLGYLFGNLITLGVYGVIKAGRVSNQIAVLEAEKGYLAARVFEQFEAIKGGMEEQIDKMPELGRALKYLKEVKKSPLFYVYEDLEKEIHALNQQYFKLSEELQEVHKANEAIKDDVKDPANPHFFKEKIEKLRAELDKVKAELAEKQKELIGPLPSRYPDYDEKIKAFEEYFKKEGKVDPDLAGEYGVGDGENDKAKMSQYVKMGHPTLCNTPDRLVHAVYRYVLERQGIKDAIQPEMKQGLYSLMALEMIRGSLLIKIDCHGYALQLNSEALMTLPPSLPERVLCFKGAGHPLETKIVFGRSNSPFTPPMGDPELPHGIDPVAAALIYRKTLTADEKEHVTALLAERLSEHEEVRLLAAKEALKGPNGRLIQQCVELIAEVGVALEKNFGLMLDQ